MDKQCSGLMAHQAQVLDPPGEPTTLVLSGAEAELVRRHADLGIEARRSFMSRGADLTIEGVGEAEVKARAKLPAGISRWLGERAVLFVRPDRAEPVVLMTWATYAHLVRSPRNGADPGRHPDMAAGSSASVRPSRGLDVDTSKGRKDDK